MVKSAQLITSRKELAAFAGRSERVIQDYLLLVPLETGRMGPNGHLCLTVDEALAWVLSVRNRLNERGAERTRFRPIEAPDLAGIQGRAYPEKRVKTKN